MSLFSLFKKKSEVKEKGLLHLGSRIPVLDLQQIEGGHHSLVDPYFQSLGKNIKILRRKFPNFEFSSLEAHEFLDRELERGVTYGAIRIDAPYVGIIGISKDFPGLCRKMLSVLRTGGKLTILTEFVPNRMGKGHSFGADNDSVKLYDYLNGRQFFELSEEETADLKAKFRDEKTVNMVRELKAAGFDTTFSETEDMSLISKSETASKKKAKGQKIYLIVATKN